MKHIKHILLIFFLILLDQISKFYFFRKNSFVSNTGTFFGLLKNMNFVFIILSIVVIVFVIYYYKEDKLRSGFDFVLAGAFGNLIDRLFRGFVVDFIDLKFWPVFNLADVFITLGVILLIYKTFRD